MKLFFVILFFIQIASAEFVKYIEHDDTIIKVDSSGLFLSIPKDEGNPDYQQYLAWVKKGNKPEKFVKIGE